MLAHGKKKKLYKMKKYDKQRLFEVTARLDKTFKPKLNEDLEQQDPEMNYKEWNPAIPYAMLRKLKLIGGSSYRPADARTSSSYYQMPDGYVVAERGNYAITGFAPVYGGIINNNGRLFNRQGLDVTDGIMEEVSEYSYVSDGLKKFLGLEVANEPELSEEDNIEQPQEESEFLPITTPVGSPDDKLFTEVVNQGIDSHLEGFTKSKFEIKNASNGNRKIFNFHKSEIPILLRRLEEIGTEEAQQWADDIQNYDKNIQEIAESIK